jgi:hypothetical protein
MTNLLEGTTIRVLKIARGRLAVIAASDKSGSQEAADPYPPLAGKETAPHRALIFRGCSWWTVTKSKRTAMHHRNELRTRRERIVAIEVKKFELRHARPSAHHRAPDGSGSRTCRAE